MKTLTAVLAAGLFLAPIASANPGQAKQIRELRAQVNALKAKNTTLASTNAQLRGRVTALGAQLTWSQTTAKSLQENLRDMTGERNYYYQQVPTPLQDAIRIVGDERTYTKLVADNQTKVPADRGYLISVAAMNYVVGHVLAPEYGYRNGIAHLPLPDLGSASSALSLQAGICGDAAFAFKAIVGAFDLPVRSVGFFYEGGEHIATETFYAGKWHYFDPTWGIYFDADASSITEARGESSPEIHQDETLLWHLISPVISDPSVVLDPATSVVIGASF